MERAIEALAQRDAEAAAQVVQDDARIDALEHEIDNMTVRMLALRHLIDETDGMFALTAAERPVLAYYANAIAHLR